MNTQATLQQMQKLNLFGMASAYESIVKLPADAHPETHECIATVIEAEWQHRNFTKSQMLLKLSKLRYKASLVDIIYDTERNLKKESIALLSDCSFIDRAQNIIITGATGSGKSFLACAIGNQACLYAHRTLYFNMNRFTEQLSLAKIQGTYIKWLNQLKKADLIILDDFGLQQLDQNAKLALLQMFEDRYDDKSVIIVSQLPVESWYNYINEPTIADAILDRILAKCFKFDLKGKSLRIKI
jgi:DNA replication protein DnaC